jgi:hypothetical protein
MKEIQLTQGYVALVDDEDFERINQHKWCVMKTSRGGLYAKRALWENKKCFSLLMHVEILGTRNTKVQIDHIKGNGLNNQKSNLRPCTFSQNQMNSRKKTGKTSRFKGVHIGYKGKFYARIKLNYKEIRIGSFETEILAAMAYNEFAKRLYGEFASLNTFD